MAAQNGHGQIVFAPGAGFQKEIAAMLAPSSGAQLTAPKSHFKATEVHYLKLVNALTAYEEERQGRTVAKARLSYKPDMKIILSDIVNRPAFFAPDTRRHPHSIKPAVFE